MGCGCGKNRHRKRRQSSRMPVSPDKPNTKANTINGIKVPDNINFNQRRSIISKINNGKINRARKTVAEQVQNRRKEQ